LDGIVYLGLTCYSFKNKRKAYLAGVAEVMMLALSKILKLPLVLETRGPQRPTYDLGDANQSLEEEKAVCVMLAALADMAIEDHCCLDMEDKYFDFLVNLLFRTENDKYRALLLKLFAELLWGSPNGRFLMARFRVTEFFFKHGLSNDMAEVWLAERSIRTPGYAKVPCSTIAMAAKGLICIYRVMPHRKRLIRMGIKAKIAELKAIVTDERARAQLAIYDSLESWRASCYESDFCYHCAKCSDSYRCTLQFCSGCKVAVYCSKFS